MKSSGGTIAVNYKGGRAARHGFHASSFQRCHVRRPKRIEKQQEVHERKLSPLTHTDTANIRPCLAPNQINIKPHTKDLGTSAQFPSAPETEQTGGADMSGSLGWSDQEFRVAAIIMKRALLGKVDNKLERKVT